MKQIRGIWLPDTDQHFGAMMAKTTLAIGADGAVGTYQKNKLDAGLEITARRRVALDIGAHVGFWSMWLADAFSEVHAFEPVEEHRACFRRNVRQENVLLHACVLGAQRAAVAMRVDLENTGKTRIEDGVGSVPMMTLDELELRDVDFIKIDVEGFEADVIKGARETIDRCRPVIVIEQNGPGHEDVKTLERMGMRAHRRMGDDWILRW